MEQSLPEAEVKLQLAIIKLELKQLDKNKRNERKRLRMKRLEQTSTLEDSDEGLQLNLETPKCNDNLDIDDIKNTKNEIGLF